MSRLNGKVHHGGQSQDMVQYQSVPSQYFDQVANCVDKRDVDPKYLATTPSGNIYIPSDDPTTDCVTDYRPNIPSSGLLPNNQKAMNSYTGRLEGTMDGPVVPIRNNISRTLLSTRPYEPGVTDRTGGSSYPSSPKRHLSFQSSASEFLWCSWRITAIVFITLSVVLAVLLGFIAVQTLLSGMATVPECDSKTTEVPPTKEDAPINRFPHRGNEMRPEENQEQILIYELPDFLHESPKHDALETYDLYSPHLARVRRSVDELSMATQSSSNAPLTPKTTINAPLPDNHDPPHKTVEGIDFLKSVHTDTTQSDVIATTVSPKLKSSIDDLKNTIIDEYVVYDDVTYDGEAEINSAENNSASDYEFAYEVPDSILSVSSNGTGVTTDKEESIPIPPLVPVETEMTANKTRLISLLSENSKANSTDLSASLPRPPRLVNDDPRSVSNSQSRNLWSLGWIFHDKNKKIETPRETKEKEKSRNKDKDSVDNNKHTTTNRNKAFDFLNKGGRKTYMPFSTWGNADKVFEKGGFHQEKRPQFSKGGQVDITQVGLDKKMSQKRSIIQQKVVTSEIKKPLHIKKPDINGNLEASPHKYLENKEKSASNLVHLEAPKVGYIQSQRELQKESSANTKESHSKVPTQGNTAMDLFPHIFEYDFPEHDYYYYEEGKDSFWFDEDWDADEIVDETTKAPPTTTKSTTQTLPPIPTLPSPYTGFPEGLQVMSLTKEEFHDKKNPVYPSITDSPIDKQPSTPVKTHSDPLPYLMEDILIVPIEKNKDIVVPHEKEIPIKNPKVYKLKSLEKEIPNSHINIYNMKNRDSNDVVEIMEPTVTQRPITVNQQTTVNYVKPVSASSKDSQSTKDNEEMAFQKYRKSSSQRHQTVYADPHIGFEPERDEAPGTPGSILPNNTKLQADPNQLLTINLQDLTPIGTKQALTQHKDGPLSKRVTVNVTIGGDNGNSSSNHPLYLLSISIPTSSEIEKSKINVNHYHDKTIEKLSTQEIPSTTQTTTTMETSQTPEARGECHCPCNSNDETSSTPEPTTTPYVTITSETTTETTQPTTTTTAIPPHILYLQMEDHQKRPQKSIPPDGTTFRRMTLGEKLKHTIPPYGYWNMQFHQAESAYIKFEVIVPRGASLGIYGRRNALPTHTSYDFIKVLSGYTWGNKRNPRSSMVPTQLETMVKYLEQGHWFLSVYNDDGNSEDLGFSATISNEFTQGCPKGCSGNGACVLGMCRCKPGFTGRDCTEMKCPILCSGHGEYNEGQCICKPGWKGQECSIRHDECEVPDCNGHGHCVDGRCHCANGFKGQYCQDVDCPHPTCSGHGWCVNGSCICQKGWRSYDCSLLDDAALQCLPGCSDHGRFDLVGQKCVCDPEWTGSECNIRTCGIDCGEHGRCEEEKCLCTDGWTGDKCDLRKCDDRCEDHGQCKNGTCICMTGWNGRHCTIAGCSESCFVHGTCVNVLDEWKCDCHDGWEGVDCSMKLESICDDGIDNDFDSLVDCADAECCSTPHCVHSTLCKSSVDPIDILLRKQPPAVTASFFQRMRFIVEESSVQIYAEIQSFNESRASVIRGRIVSGRGSGLVGVRISHFRPENTGFTLSRHGGWFDLMVNGGGAVKLLFGKSQFLPVTKTISVPWNKIVVIDTVVMTTTVTVPPPLPTTCHDHDYSSLKPVVLATWKHAFQGGCPHCTAILAESQVVQESLAIPGTGLQLVYHSSRAVGYESTIQLQLTPEKIPATLKRIHLIITIEGVLFEKVFEADEDIKYTFAWNRLNVYRQKVYGITWALVRVGYAYSNCDQVIWDAQSTQVSGHDISVSDIGGWDLSIHHRYNFHEGILQKGDGRNLYLNQRPRIMKVLMGDGRQREISCPNCDGPARRQRLLTPVALAPAPDGSLYIADFNFIRRIYPDKTVKTVVKLNETRVAYRYHLTVSPVDGSVYVSDPESYQILKVRDPDSTSRPEDNFVAFVGSGERCLPGDEIGCGDGGLARDAKLQYPKGLVVSLDEVLYFADGTNVRSVDADGIITTVIGTHRHRSHWYPLPCSGTLPVADVSLRWPTTLAISPLDGSLYVLDDHHVLRLTQDDRIKVVAGRPLHCPPASSDTPSDMASMTTLRSPQSLAFDSNGNLYIAESDTERVNRIRLITSDARIHSFAGAKSKCNCRDINCICFDESHVLAANAIFSTISAIAITPDGTVHVLDQGNLRIRSITSSIPQPDRNRDYHIYSPETQEMFVFNRFGHHVETRNIPTHRTIYTFIYNVNTSNGKLSSVTDAAGNKINFLRDYSGQVTMIENSRQQKCHLKMSRMRRLVEIVTPDEHNVTLTYYGSSGLLRSRMDSTGRAHVYDYDKYGRLTRAVTPSGQIIDLSFDLREQGARVTVTRDGGSPIVMVIKANTVTQIMGDASTITSQLPDGSITKRNSWGHYISTETLPYSVLETDILASSFPIPGRQRTQIGEGLINSFDWKYYVDRTDDMQEIEKVGRLMVVNGEKLLDFNYDLYSGTEAFADNRHTTLLNVTYDDLGRPLYWTPVEPFESVSLTYDRYGLIQEWKWGLQKEHYLYDRSGRFEGIEYADGTKVTYAYKESHSIKPYKRMVQNEDPHLLEYDASGALSAITTPKGHKYSFRLQPSVLHNRLAFTMPGSPKHPYQILYSDSGHLLAMVLPKHEGRIVYNYDKAGRLQHQIFGDGSVEYGYQPETGLIRSVTLRELAYEQRIDNKYHAGLVKEQRIRFGPAVPMHAVKMRFLYDGNARPHRIQLELDAKDLPEYLIKYNSLLGTLEGIDDLKISHINYNRTIIQDSTKVMRKVIDFNSEWELAEETLTIRGRMVHRFRYTYDMRGRVATKQIWRQPGPVENVYNYTYTPEGFLKSVNGAGSWQFKYDANGNIIGFVQNQREIPAVYDVADRLIGWGDQEINVHDSAGRVIRQKGMHYSYTARGNIRHAWDSSGFRKTYRYDHQGRLTSMEDHVGNVTQFFYADISRPHLHTHVHYPVSGITHTLYYDTKDHLIAIRHEKEKIWVATDNLGSPVAAYDAKGNLMKEIERSPFGAVLKDTKPELELHVDFCGSIRDKQTGTLLFGVYAYDPIHGQWMSPRYDKILNVPSHLSYIYMHRFRDNNPVNTLRDSAKHFTDMHSWLRKFTIDMNKVLGSNYHDDTLYNPQKALHIDGIEPSIRMISGLSCSNKYILDQFARPSFLKDSLVQMDEPRLVSSKWTMLGQFSSSGPVLGPGILISKQGGSALVTLVPSSENSVVQAVARDVLNGSALLDVTLPHHLHHTLYLIKEDLHLMDEDLEQLKRLSGLFNVTRQDSEYPEIRVMGKETLLVLMYGISPDNARHRILRHVHHRSAKHAWEAEQRLLQTGGLSLHPWTPEERDILLREGKVPGFSAAELHSVHRFPLLADDSSNVVFRRDVHRRKRSKS